VVYYVPENEQAWIGRAEELADRLWSLGVFVASPKTLERIAAFRANGESLPKCDVDIQHKFGDIGIADANDYDPVPNYLYDIKCPFCAADVMQATYDVWGSESEIPAKNRLVTCPGCGSRHLAKDLRFGEPMSFARFYIFVSDCEQEEWDPRFRTVIEGIVGRCREYWEWAT
jgi:DNA-directed RNA polymerase subunit RPC12/RpoP